MIDKKVKKRQIEEAKKMPWDEFNEARQEDYELRMKHERENDTYMQNLPDFYTPEATQVIPVSNIVARRIVFSTHSDKSLEELALIYEDRGNHFMLTLETLISLRNKGATERELVQKSTKPFFNAMKKIGIKIIS